MSNAISQSLKKRKWDTCAVKDRVYAPPKSNTPTPPPHESKKDIFIPIYKLKKTMYSNQMGLLPQAYSFDNKLIIVIHDVDSNSLWAEALKYNTGSKLILGCAQALEQM